MSRSEPGMTRTASCQCGTVTLELSGKPIVQPSP